MQQLFALSLGIAAMVFAATQAPAQTAAPQCGPRSDVVQALASRYGETPRAMGLAPGNRLMEVYASASGSWTLTVSMADGRTCLIAAGESFESLAQPLAQLDPPA